MDQRIASDVIEQNTVAYAQQILTNTFPNVIDGFKKVRRRIIITQPPDRFFSGQELISNTIRIHPYGDMSIYDAGCRMAEPFRYSFPLLYLKGNTGSYSGDKAASARYTEFKLSDFCKDMFITGINFKTIPTELTEDLSGHEIRYLIPKIPTALLYHNESIGFGYSSLTIPMKFENICDLTIDFVSCQDKTKWDFSKLSKLFIPFFPVHVFIKNKNDLLASYKRGIFNTPVETEGYYKIIAQNAILIRTMSYGNSPNIVRDRITNALLDKNSWFSKNECNFRALSESRNYADFQITVKRSVNIFELIEKVRKIAFIRSSVHPVNNYVFNDKMFNLNPPDILKLWYEERYRSIFSAKKLKQQDLQSQYMKYSTYLIVCEHVDEVIAIIRTDKPEEEVRFDLKKRFDLSTRQCTILLESNLQLLMRSKRKELEERIFKIETELKELNESFPLIDNEIIDSIRSLRKKYKTDETFGSRESNFIGCLLIDNQGIINIQSEDEMIEYARLFSNQKIRFIEYHKCINSIQFTRPGISYKYITSLPQTISSQGVSLRSKYNLLFIRDNGRGYLSNDIAVESAKCIFNYTTNDAYYISTNGTVDTLSTDMYSGRKQHNNILYTFDKISDIDEYVVLSINAAHPTILRLQTIDPTKDRVMFSDDGETSILAVLPKGTNRCIVNLPHFFKQNVMIVDNIDKYLSKNKVNDIGIRNFERF